jgi:hypothetical protein
VIPPIAIKMPNRYLPSVVKHTSLNSKPDLIMKSSLRLALAALACLVGLAHAKTITVDNRVGSVAMYSNLQTAIDAANSGDTLLIAGSPTSYGSIVIPKRLQLVGNGYYLAENQMPGINMNHVHLQEVALGSTSSDTFKSSSDGSQFIGIVADRVMGNSFTSNGRSYSGPARDVLFDSCRINSIGYHDPAYTYLWVTFSARRCWFSGVFAPPGCTLRNCYVESLNAREGCSISNCILSASGTSSRAESSITNSIFVASGDGITAAAFSNNCQGSVNYCLAVGGLPIKGAPTFLKPGVGNQPTIAYLEDVFIYSNPVDRKYLLTPSSPARGIGLNGVDLGMFGGAGPYVISGVPAMPRITHFATPAAATSSSGLRFEVKAKSF